MMKKFKMVEELEEMIKTNDILSDQDIEMFKLKYVSGFANGFIYHGENGLAYLLDPIKDQIGLYKVWFQYKRWEITLLLINILEPARGVESFFTQPLRKEKFVLIVIVGGV